MAVKKIIMSGEIGWDIHPFLIREEFTDAAGDDIEIDMATPGGDVFLASEINDIISNYKKEFPKAQIILNIIEASSAGSHISTNQAIDLRLVKDESVMMIHNPMTGRYGDYRVMGKVADFLDRFSGILAISYSKKMKNSIKETREIMDNETWYIGGKEIIKAGLADGFMDKKSKSTVKDMSVIRTESELRFKAVMRKVKAKEIEDDNFEKIAAITKDFDKIIDKKDNQNNTTSDSTARGGNNNNKGEVLMDIKELKEKHPEIYAEAIEAGKAQGSETEKERVKALLEMKNKKDFEGISKIHDRIDEGIANGESASTVELGIMALLTKNDVAAAADTNDIGNLNTPVVGTVSGEVKTEINDDNRREF